MGIARRRAKPSSGSNSSQVREARAAYGDEGELPDLEDIRYVIVGGLATALYMPPRMTVDTDLLIAKEDLERAEALLAREGSQRTGTLAIGGSTWRLPSGRRLDLIALDQAWVSDALDSAVRDDAGRPCVALPYLVLMKLESSRLQDLADISRMLGCADEDRVQEVRAVVGQYRLQDMDDLESMIRLGKLEHE